MNKQDEINTIKQNIDKVAGVTPAPLPFDIPMLLKQLSGGALEGIDFKQGKVKELEKRLQGLRAEQGSGAKGGKFNLDGLAAIGDIFLGNNDNKLTNLNESLKAKGKNNTGEIYNLENQLIGYQNSIGKDRNNLFDTIKDFQPKPDVGTDWESKRAFERFKNGLQIDRDNNRSANTQSILDGKPKKEAKANDNQYLSAGFGRRMQQAERDFDRLERDGYDRGALTEGVKSGTLPAWLNGLKGHKLLAWEQAERNFVNATLRKESGAAIAPTEFASAELQYFPRFGDDEQLREQKKRNRFQVIAAMKGAAGVAWEKVRLVSGKPTFYDKNGKLVDVNAAKKRQAEGTDTAADNVTSSEADSRAEKIKALQALGGI